MDLNVVFMRLTNNTGVIKMILVVDDNPTIGYLLVLMLKKMGFKADSADNGLKAVWCVRSSKYDLVLMDVNMPDMNGYEAAAAIRAHEYFQGKAAVPIVAITGENDRRRCIDSGMNDYMQKPVTPLNLRKMLQKWLPESAAFAGNKPVQHYMHA
jgi:CheY-like chemotaxis protein